jgi:septum formation protein
VDCGSRQLVSEIILASGSRRRELLAQIGVDFKVMAVDIDEQRRSHESAESYVQRLACNKAQVGFNRAGKSIPALGADTCIGLDNAILGKPVDREEAMFMLETLSGRTHRVLTAVTLTAPGYEATRLCVSLVSFRPISATECQAYWATGESMGKAGAYAIQGKGAIFVKSLQGSYSGVMGLPLFETAELLMEIGIQPLLSI